MWKKVVSALFLFLTVSQCKQLEEPHCSKYDFEEKVLEKMVRMEFQMETMKSEMTKSVNTIENLKEKVSDALMSFDEKMKTENVDVEENLKERIATSTVAFKARLNNDISVSNGQTIVFPTVLFNAGDAYCNDTGKFTAPISGTYLFTVAFCVNSNQVFLTSIMVDGTKYTVTLLRGDDSRGCATADTIAVLTAGQTVWVEVIPGGHSGGIIDQNSSYRWNTFAGTLVNK